MDHLHELKTNNHAMDLILVILTNLGLGWFSAIGFRDFTTWLLHVVLLIITIYWYYIRIKKEKKGSSEKDNTKPTI